MADPASTKFARNAEYDRVLVWINCGAAAPRSSILVLGRPGR